MWKWTLWCPLSYITDTSVINCHPTPPSSQPPQWNCRFSRKVSLWTFNSASFIWVAEVGASLPFISSAAFELSQMWKAKYLHVGPCLFNVKGTLTQQSKWMKKALDKTPPAADEYQAAPQRWSHRFNLLFRAWETGTRGLLRGLSGEAQACWRCCLCEKRRSVHLELAQAQRD